MPSNGNRKCGSEQPNASRRTFMKATGTATATAALGTGAGVGAEDDDRGGWDDDTPEIVDETLGSLTLRQKVAQMTQVEINTFDPSASSIPDNFDVDTLGEYFSELGIGSILSGGASPPSFDPQTVVSGINDLQQYNLDNADHEIPFLWGVDAVHGNPLLSGATSLPQRINMGATRDIETIEAAERHTSEAVAAMGAHWTFAPTTDLQRDPRWGRFFEGISEDPMLLGEVSNARVQGLEDQDRVAATVKHFGAYSVPENGNDRAHADASMRDLRTDLLPPYDVALDADPRTVMVNSGAVNGKPAHASSWLLETVLRRRFGFDGLILSDYDDFNRLITNHDYVPDFQAAVREGINAGVDMYMIGTTGSAPGPVEFIETTVSLIEDGEIAEERIDEAVRRVLELKAELGLFEQPTVDESTVSDVVGGAQDLSRQLATESLVLLENDAPTDSADPALPLSGDEQLLVTGPGTGPASVGWLPEDTGFLMQHGGWTLGWQGIQEGYPSADGPRPRQSRLHEVLADELGSSNVTYEPTGFYADPYNPGTSDANGDFTFTDQEEQAVRSGASDADAVVVVLGEGPHNEGFGDRNRLALDPAQQALVDAVDDEAPDTPVIGVILAGSPRGNETLDDLDAVLFAGQPGSDGGRAIADVLLGEANPSGKLAFQWPQSVGQVPIHYNAKPPLDGHEPRYPFGHGLSYTDFEYSNLSVSPDSVDDPGRRETVTVSVDVENVGDRAGDHVVEVFNTQSFGSVIQPNRRLLGFERVSLSAGESTTVEIEASLRALEVIGGDVPATSAKVVEPAEYELSIGDLTTTLTVGQAGSISGRGQLVSIHDVNGDGQFDAHDVQTLMKLAREEGDGRGNGNGRGRGNDDWDDDGHGNDGRGNGRGNGGRDDDDR